MLIALPILAISLTLSEQIGSVLAIAVVIVLGVPHGALDIEIGRTLLKDQLGRAWFGVFALPYLILVSLVLIAWNTVPELTLALFLLASVWHFGAEDTGSGDIRAIVYGGIPVAVPTLVHPQATAHVLSEVSGLVFATPPVWLIAASLGWLFPASLWTARTLSSGTVRNLILPLTLSIGFAVLPPITAFSLYFVAIHAPAHVAALISHPSRAPRVRDVAAAWQLAMPTTALTVLIGAALWVIYPGEPTTRLVCVTIQLLAALTLPHMLLDGWLGWREAKDCETREAEAANKLSALHGTRFGST